MCAVLEKYPTLTAVMFCDGPAPDKCDKYVAEGRLLCVMKSGFGPCAFVEAYVSSGLRIASEHALSALDFQHKWTTAPNWKHVSTIMDARDLGITTLTTEQFVLGFQYAWCVNERGEDVPESFLAKFELLLASTDALEAEKIATKGESCHRTLMKLARNRAVNIGGSTPPKMVSTR